MRRLAVLLLFWVGCTITMSAQAKQTMEVLRTETTETKAAGKIVSAQ